MTHSNRIRVSKLSLGLIVALAAAPVFAQNTSAGVNGQVVGAGGQPVAGAEVTIVHTESGMVSRAVTDANGRYNARGLRVGGPYTITVNKAGAGASSQEGIFLNLDQVSQINIALNDGIATLATVRAIAIGGSEVFSADKMGAGAAISREQLDTFASIQRNLQDYARLDPRISQTDKERGEISAGGQNTRFNTITIDGVNTSDTFGLEANNLPTAKQPISIDAIEAVQVNIANYDATQRGYTGANINAVTRSGTNEFRGSVYYVYRDDRLSGDRYVRASDSFIAPPESEDNTWGLTLGGPLLKDRLFFFASYEDYQSTRLAPQFGPLGGSGTQVFITPQNITDTINLAQSRYGIDIGSGDIPADNMIEVKDALLKLDWNLADNHRASLRYNKTDQTEPVFAGFGGRNLSLSSHWWNQAKVFESWVGQWFADWSDVFSTEFRVSRRDYESVPINNANLPQVDVRFTGGTPPAGVLGGTRVLRFGTERSRHFNELRTQAANAYFAGNLFLGAHELKAGLDWENTDFFNAFLQDTRGNYTFNCLLTAQCANSFEAGRPISYQVQVPRAGRVLNDGVAQWDLGNLGAFVQDTWSVNNNLTLTYGLRYDVTQMNDSPLFNAAAAGARGPLVGGRASGGFGLNNSTTLDGETLLQPRIGFNYTFDSDRPMQLRGGFGLFQGSAANVWLSNPYSNTGVATQVVGCGIGGFPTCPTTGVGIFSPNPATQPTAFVGAIPAANVDFLDENLDQPSVWKANLAFEHELPFWGAILSAELILTEVEDGLYYQHLNLGAPTAAGPDGRPLFWNAGGYNTNCWTDLGIAITTGACAGANAPRARAQNNPAFNNVLIARPTSKGGGENFTIALQRPRQDDAWSWSLAYSFTEATEVSPLTSSVANSNWLNNQVFDPNAELESRANYVVRDRFISTLSYRHFFVTGYATEFGLFYEGRKGKPYSWTYINDLNGDGVGGNDLMYLPAAPGSNQVVFRGGAAEEQRFWTIVNANPDLLRFRGGVVERNASFAPWTNSFDLRISQQLPGFMDGHKTDLILDILNVGNLLNKDWGRIDEIGFPLNRSFVYNLGRDTAGRYIYGLGDVEAFVTRQERGESQWAAQVTLRYSF